MMLRIDRNYKSLVLLYQFPCSSSILSALVFAVSVCAAQNTPAPTPADIFRQARSSVVLIVGSASNDKVAQGSGFIVGKDKIVTNYHVIAGLSAAYVLFADGGTEVVAGVVAAEANQDTAVLDVRTAARPPLALGDELNLHEGESVLAVGAPRGLELSLTNGIVSAFRKSEQKFLIQNTAPIAPGSSGGPLLDSRGRVVGLTTSQLADTPGVYFSIGIGAVKRLLKAAPRLSQSFADWAREKGVKSSPSLRETFEWIKGKLEEKAGSTSSASTGSGKQTYQSYDFRLYQPGDECVLALDVKERTADSPVGDCVLTSESDFSETLPIYYLTKAESHPYVLGVPAVLLKFDGEKMTVHTEGKDTVTGCRDASKNFDWRQHESRDYRDDHTSIDIFRYPAEDNEDLAKRLADAFNHAAALCANRRPVSKEPF